jgi:beta-lactamase regulating signal transducer with metallopeptidase domain
MNYSSCLLFLVALSIVNLLILVSLYILDFAGVTSKQKNIFIRIGLIIICSAMFLFFVMQFFSFHTLEIILSDKLINQLPINSVLPIITKPHADWAFYLFIAYVAGFFVMLFRILFSYFNSSRQLAYSDEFYIQRHTVLLSKNVQSPLSFGFPKTKIYLPFNTEEKWTEREIEICLAHEQIHIDQNDAMWKLLSLIVEALLFFAPWVYFLHRRFKLEMEIFCDEKTCSRTNASIQEYGGLLLTMASIQSNNFIYTNIQTSTLKRRVLAMKSKTTRRPLLVSMLSIALLFSGGAAIATTDGILAKKNIYKITSKLFIDGQLVSSPVIINYANQKSSIQISDKGVALKIALIAKDAAKDNIRVNYDIQYTNGDEKMHSKPEMVLVPNQEGVIRIASDSNHIFEMKVVVERK